MTPHRKRPAIVAEPVALYDAKTNLSALVDRAASGDAFIITKSGKPMARLMPLADEPVNRQPGRGRGQWRVSEAFDAPLPHDVLDAFEGTPAAAPPPRPSRARPKRG
jgi:prevent-host-death family protein